jgi:hypothetical protein
MGNMARAHHTLEFKLDAVRFWAKAVKAERESCLGGGDSKTVNAGSGSWRSESVHWAARDGLRFGQIQALLKRLG